MKIAILSCSKKKNPLGEVNPIEAKDLYQGNIFKKSYTYAKDFLKLDKIYILSAKYGLLHPSDKISSYDKTLKNFSSKERKEWSEKVLSQMKSENIDLEKAEFFFLTGKVYYKEIIGEGKCEKFELPFVNNECKNQGQILQFLNSKIKNEKS